jgi:hypothetical protein
MPRQAKRYRQPASQEKQQLQRQRGQGESQAVKPRQEPVDIELQSRNCQRQ